LRTPFANVGVDVDVGDRAEKRQLKSKAPVIKELTMGMSSSFGAGRPELRVCNTPVRINRISYEWKFAVGA
jgi:hypothetical protein